VVDRLVRDYGIGYIKFDYNVDALLGTETGADSFGQGLLEHQRAYLRWIDGLHARYPDLVLENCGSGGGREDYAILSHHQIQSSSDERDYRLYPAIVIGSSAAVLPEQLGVWAYPTRDQDPDAASFNLVNAMLVRIVLSGNLDALSAESRREVADGIRIYKDRIRPRIPHLVPFYPLGLPRYDDARTPIALGMRDSDAEFVAVWRLNGGTTVAIPHRAAKGLRLLYPTDRGIAARATGDGLEVRFPRAYMAVILEIPR
jgi:alpha-galactosidase